MGRPSSKSEDSIRRAKLVAGYRQLHCLIKSTATSDTAVWLDFNCALPECGKPIRKLLSQVMGRRHFCCRSHFYKAIKNPDYKRDEVGCYLARKIVSKYFRLRRGNVVHHHDFNNDNNALSNLAVFASNADHISFHRGGPALPIWDGKDLVPRPGTTPDYQPHREHFVQEGASEN